MEWKTNFNQSMFGPNGNSTLLDSLLIFKLWFSWLHPYWVWKSHFCLGNQIILISIILGIWTTCLGGGVHFIVCHCSYDWNPRCLTCEITFHRNIQHVLYGGFIWINEDVGSPFLKAILGQTSDERFHTSCLPTSLVLKYAIFEFCNDEQLFGGQIPSFC